MHGDLEDKLLAAYEEEAAFIQALPTKDVYSTRGLWYKGPQLVIPPSLQNMSLRSIMQQIWLDTLAVTRPLQPSQQPAGGHPWLQMLETGARLVLNARGTSLETKHLLVCCDHCLFLPTHGSP